MKAIESPQRSQIIKERQKMRLALQQCFMKSVAEGEVTVIARGMFSAG